jgi:hypothetical protein
VDNNGNAFAGFAPPVASAPPTISGTAQPGQTLTESHSYSGNPTSNSYHWEVCDSSGANCSAITGATAHTYTLAASDVGHTIRVAETASNARGSSSQDVSSQTAQVTALPPAVSITTPTDHASYSQGQVINASYSCSEGAGGPGLKSPGGCVGTVANGSAVDTSSAGTHAFVVTTTSQDGQSASKTVSYTVIGTPAGKPPTVTISSPVNGAHYRQRQSIHANYACQDPAGAPGIRSCTATTPNGALINTSAAGQHAFTVTAVSKDGQSTSKTVSYTVTAAAIRPATARLHLTRITARALQGRCKSELHLASTATASPSRCDRGQLTFTGSVDSRANGQTISITLTARISGRTRVIHKHAHVAHGHYRLIVSVPGRQTHDLENRRDTGGDRWSYTISYNGNKSLKASRITGHLTLEVEHR